MAAAHVLVPLPHHVGGPIGGRLGDDELEVGVALEDPAEQHVPAGAHRPPDDLGQVDPDVIAVLGLGRLARVGVHGEAVGLARGPDRVVDAVVVRRAVVPHGRHHYAPDARVLRDPLDLFHRSFRSVADGHQGDARSALGAVGAQVDEEAVVGAGAGERQVGVVDLARRQTSAERR